MQSRPRLAALGFVLAFAAGCAGQTTPRPTVSATGTSNPTPPPTVRPIATPNATVAPPLPLETVSGALLFAGGKGTAATLFVEVHNPNTTWGIVRGTFEVTAVDPSGGVVAVFGQGGVPGASCCTIYQLPPLENYWVSGDATAAEAKEIRSTEIRIATGWTQWSQADATRAEVTVSGTKLRVDGDGYASVTGRINMHDPNAGKYNVAVFATLQGGNGSIFASTVVDCVETSTGAAFQATTSAPLGGLTNVKLSEVFAVTTTITGVGAVDSPPGC
jgi:hypothetical protein